MVKWLFVALAMRGDNLGLYDETPNLTPTLEKGFQPFPATLDQADAAQTQARQLPPPTTLVDALLAQPDAIDLVAAAMLGFTFWFGLDFALAPLGLANDLSAGVRAEERLGRLLSSVAPDEARDRWLSERIEGLRSAPPLAVRTLTATGFGAGGLLAERILRATLEDATFVLSVSVCSCFGGGLYELIRPRRPSRDEAMLESSRFAEFCAFADGDERAEGALEEGGSCLEGAVVSAFRRCYSKYRGGQGITDAEICMLLRRYARQQQGVSARSPAGYYKGISIRQGADQAVR